MRKDEGEVKNIWLPQGDTSVLETLRRRKALDDVIFVMNFNSLILCIATILKNSPTKTNQPRKTKIVTDSFSSEWKFPALQWDVVTGKSKY